MTHKTLADIDTRNLRDADLILARLQGAPLAGVDLAYATLIGADLRGADLRNANLRNTDLRYADLRGANLAGAHLTGADLHLVNLCGTNLADTEPRLVILTAAVYDSATVWPPGFNPRSADAWRANYPLWKRLRVWLGRAARRP